MADTKYSKKNTVQYYDYSDSLSSPFVVICEVFCFFGTLTHQEHEFQWRKT